MVALAFLWKTLVNPLSFGVFPFVAAALLYVFAVGFLLFVVGGGRGLLVVFVVVLFVEVIFLLDHEGSSRIVDNFFFIAYGMGMSRAGKDWDRGPGL